MVGIAEIRAIAMGLPQVVEGGPVPAARRIAAFKVAGKSFLGIEMGGRSITLSLPEIEAKSFALKNAKAFEEIRRNRKTFLGLRVDLSATSADQVKPLIEASWRYSLSGRKTASDTRESA